MNRGRVRNHVDPFTPKPMGLEEVLPPPVPCPSKVDGCVGVPSTLSLPPKPDRCAGVLSRGRVRWVEWVGCGGAGWRGGPTSSRWQKAL